MGMDKVCAEFFTENACMKSLVTIGLAITLLVLAGCTAGGGGATIQKFVDSQDGAHISRLYGLWGHPDYSGSVNDEPFVAWETDLTRSSTGANALQYSVIVDGDSKHHHFGSGPITLGTPGAADYCRIRVFLDAGDKILFSDVEESFLGCGDYPIPLGWLAHGEWQ